MMKTNLNNRAQCPYEAPTLELLEVAVEKGFAVSPETPINDWGYDDESIE